MKIPARKRKGEAGQAALLIVLAIGTFLLGAVGLAVDASNLYAQRQMAQAAADAGAQAGLLSFRDGTYKTSTLATPYTCATSDTQTPCSYASANGFKNAANPNDTVTVTYGDNTSASKPTGVTLPAGVSPSWMTVTITRNVPTTLMRLLGVANSAITVSATAAAITSPLPCFIALSQSGTGFTFNNGTIDMPSCGIAVDSNMSWTNGTITASSIQVVGTCSGSGCSGSVTTGAPNQADPFSNIPPPTYNPSNCDYNTGQTPVKINGGTNPLSPGTYCGGISINNGTVTFSSGTYILAGGGLNVSNGTVSGSGVTFYNTVDANNHSGQVNINGGTVTLSASTSGPLEGMLFFQDRTVNAEADFTNGTLNLNGILYFEDSLVKYTNGGTAALSIVANSLNFSNGNLTVNPPPQTYKLALVQ